MIPRTNYFNFSPLRISLGLLAAAVFILPGLALIPYPGIQNDEALFSLPLYPPVAGDFWVSFHHHPIPVMIISYMGALKTWLFKLIFALFAPSAFSVRIPSLLAGAITILLFYKFLEKILDTRIAVAGTLLLATDTTFLLTTCFDWGPVALQHLLLMAGILPAACFWRSRRTVYLFLAFFFFGLALWDKALFVWILSGMAVAAAAIFHREIKPLATRRNLIVALVAFLLGALPLVRYNQRRHLATFRGNTSFSTDNLTQKLWELRFSLDGSALFGYLVYEDDTEQPKEPATMLERASVELHRMVGERRPGYLGGALLLSILLAPLWWRTRVRRAILFSLIAMTVAWVQMFFTLRAGGSAHHVVLLWPFPHLVVAAAAVALTNRARRFSPLILAAVVGIISLQNLLLTNEYLAQLIRDGAAGVWSDAIYPLARSLDDGGEEKVWITDWGIMDSLRLLDRGHLKLEVGWDAMNKPVPTSDDRKRFDQMFANPADVFVGHIRTQEAFAGIGARFEQMAAARGFRKHVLSTILDSNGRPVFEVYRFVKATSI